MGKENKSIVNLLEQFDAGTHLDNGTLAASERKKIFSKPIGFVRHTLWIFNKSLTDDLYLKSTDSDKGKKITIRKDSDRDGHHECRL